MPALGQDLTEQELSTIIIEIDANGREEWFRKGSQGVMRRGVSARL